MSSGNEGKDFGRKGLEEALKKIENSKPQQQPQKKEGGLNLPKMVRVETDEELSAKTTQQANELALWESDDLIPGMTHNLERTWTLLGEHGDAGDREDDERDLYRAAILKQFRKVQAAVMDVFAATAENPIAHEKVVGAYAHALVQFAPIAKWALRAVLYGLEIENVRLPGLLELGLFKEEEEQSDETIRINKTRKEDKKKFFAPSGASEEVVNLLKEKAERVLKEAREYFKECLEKLGRESNALGVAELTPTELAASKPGHLILNVPDGFRNGKVFGGGFVLLLSDGETVEVIDAIGHFQNCVLKLRDAGRKLPLKSLTEATFRWTRTNLTETMLPAAYQRFKKKQEEEQKDLNVLHSILRRGIEMDAVKQEQEEKRAKEAEWLLDSKVGAVEIFWQEWEDRQPGRPVVKYSPVKGVMERRQDGWIRLASYEPELEPLFGDKFKEWMNPEERFQRIPSPLGKLLRILYSAARAVRNRNQRAAVESSVQSEPTTTVDSSTES